MPTVTPTSSAVGHSLSRSLPRLRRLSEVLPAGRRLAVAALASVAFAALLPLPAGAAVPQAPSPSPELRALPEVDLAGLDEGAQRQLRQVRALVEQVRGQQGDGPTLGLALGELGALYFLHARPEAAAAALGHAAALLPGDVRWPYLSGLVHAEQGDLAAAAAAFERALEVQPDHLPSWVRLGGVRLAQGRPEEATQYFRRGLELSPACARCAMGLGQGAEARGDAAAAAEHFRRALLLQPQATSLHRALAEALRAAGDEAGAAAAEAAATEAAGDVELVFYDPVVRWVRGVATGAGGHLQRGQRAAAAGDLAAARAALQEATAADPENALAHRTLGRVLLATGDTRAGLEALSVAIQLDPSSPEGYRELADALAGAGLAQEAAATYGRVLLLDPGSAAAHLGLGRLLARGGRAREAIPHFEHALERAPEDPGVRYERALHLASVDRREEALAELRRLAAEAGEGSPVAADAAAPVAPRPDPVQVRLNLAFLLEVEGRDGEAREELQRVVADGLPESPGPEGHTALEGPLRARAELALGRIAERAGDLEAALAHHRRAVEAAPLPPAFLRLGSTLAATGDYAAAADAYGRALEAAPGHRAGRVAHATSLMLAGRDAEAAASLAAGLERLPEDPFLRYELALLRAASPADAVRDPAAALELARASFGDLANPVHAQALALAYAASGDFEAAVRAQERILAALPADDPRRSGANARLELYRQRRAPRAPWLQDPSLLYRPTVPVPRGEGE